MFLRDDCMFIPACFVSYAGKALDEKTPLHRAHQAMSKQGARLFKHLGFEAPMVNNIGLEQELFFIPREAYERRMDLQFTGRTVLGKMRARGQEMCDHYMAAPNEHGAMACMKEIQDSATSSASRSDAPPRGRAEPVRVRALLRPVITQTDQNLVVMQICEEVAAKPRSRRASAGEALRRASTARASTTTGRISTLCGR